MLRRSSPLLMPTLSLITSHQPLITILLLLFIPLATLTASSSTINITCSYFDEYRTHIGLVHSCSVEGNQSVLADDTFLAGVTDYKSQLSTAFNPNVQHFAAENKFYHYIPAGLAKVFGTRLRGLEIISSRLKVLRKKDMQPFTRLGYLNLRGNELECLDADVFADNFVLMFVSLRHNNIRRIDARVFDDLVQVQQFWLQANHCISQNANNKYEIASLRRGVSANCAAPKYGESTVRCEQLVEAERDTVTRLKRELEAEVKRNEELSVEIMGLKERDEH